MTKFDNSSNLPQIFSKHKISILPITRGSYILAPVQAYHEFPQIGHEEIVYLEFPSYLESIVHRILQVKQLL
jgi:hypothetical protein